MYIETIEIPTCRCGLNAFTADFITDDCVFCYVDDYSMTCILCGYIDSHELFTNQLCVNCFEWCTA